MSNFENQINNYISECLAFSQDKSKSKEYYFGESNQLKDGLIFWVDNLREAIKIESEKNPNFAPKDGLKICQQQAPALANLVSEVFNIEKCQIGFQNVINACCYVHISNSDLYSTSKKAENARYNLNDIVDTNNGFKYKNKKGIYYVIVLGYPIISDDRIFTSGEAAAIITHELGHAMQHVINSLNMTTCLQLYEQLYQASGVLYSFDAKTRRYITRTLNRIRKAIKSNTAELDKIGKELFEESKKSEGISFSSMDQDKIQSLDKNPDWDTDKSKKLDIDLQTAKRKRRNPFRMLGHLIGAIISIPASVLYIPATLLVNSKAKDKELNKFKIFEETADNFCAMYGLGVEQGSVQKKFAELAVNLSTPTVFSKIPLMDSIISYDSMMQDYWSALNGYPSDLGRMLNLYKAAKFELANNKDLSSDAKKELEAQIEQYKSFYEDFVKLNSKKGVLYRLLACIHRKRIDKAAQKDKTIYDLVLNPLQKRADSKFNPEAELGDAAEE